MEELETAKRENTYTHFIKDSIRDLKVSGHCYVYNKEQVDEVLKKINKSTIVETNECGYTIKIKRDRRDRNEFLEQKNKE